MNKHIFFNIINSCYISTLIKTIFWMISLCCSMSDNFLLCRSIFSLNSFVMIAFDPKSKISFSFHHFIISLFIIVKHFQISYVSLNFIPSKCEYQVRHVWKYNQNYPSNSCIRCTDNCRTCHYSSNHQYGSNNNWAMNLRLLFYWNVCFSYVWIQCIKEELAKSLNDSLIYLQLCIRINTILRACWLHWNLNIVVHVWRLLNCIDWSGCWDLKLNLAW